jgi:hypothetical protein
MKEWDEILEGKLVGETLSNISKNSADLGNLLFGDESYSLFSICKKLFKQIEEETESREIQVEEGIEKLKDVMGKLLLLPRVAITLENQLYSSMLKCSGRTFECWSEMADLLATGRGNLTVGYVRQVLSVAELNLKSVIEVVKTCEEGVRDWGKINREMHDNFSMFREKWNGSLDEIKVKASLLGIEDVDFFRFKVPELGIPIRED